MDYQTEIIAEYDREIGKTRKMLEAIPADADLAFKPHPKSMPLGNLAGHLTDMVGDWAITTLTQDKLEFPADHKWEAYVPKSKQELLEKFDSKLQEARKALADTTPEKWDQHWKFIWGPHTLIDQPRCQVFRGQLLYPLAQEQFRPAGGKVGGIPLRQILHTLG